MVFTRHGKTRLNSERVFQPWTPDGDHLVDEGMAEARRLGKTLGPVPFSTIYASDWHRAIHTAQLINGSLDRPLNEIVACSGLRDFDFGTLCGMTWDELRESRPDLDDDRTRNRHRFAAPGGDSFPDFHDRNRQELERILSECPGGNVLVVAHSYVVISLIIASLELPLAGHASESILNASASIVEFRERKLPGELLLFNWKRQAS